MTGDRAEFQKELEDIVQTNAPMLECLAPNLTKAQETKKLFEINITRERKELCLSFERKTSLESLTQNIPHSGVAEYLPRPQLVIHPWQIYPSYGHWDDHFDDGYIGHMALNGLPGTLLPPRHQPWYHFDLIFKRFQKYAAISLPSGGTWFLIFEWWFPIKNLKIMNHLKTLIMVSMETKFA